MLTIDVERHFIAHIIYFKKDKYATH